MHIVQIYHAPVPVRLYGGMERVIEALCQGLVELGHKVTLMAYPGEGEIPGVNFISLAPLGTRAHLDYPQLIPDDADMLHFHIPMEQDRLDRPYVVTMHGNLQAQEDPQQLPRKTIFLSARHAHLHGRELFVFNGLNPQLIPFAPCGQGARDYLAFLGRGALKRKGLHLARHLAKQLQLPLKVGGKRGLSWGKTRYLGHLNNHQKFDLLAQAKALVFPILWEEPFGLVQIEAMFCGTPVWALRRGSVPEVLGQAGHDHLFLSADTIEELIALAQTWHSVDPQALRDYASLHFSHISMCQRYLELYSSLN